MSKPKQTAGERVAAELAKRQDAGATLSRPQQDAARAHRNGGHVTQSKSGR